MSDAASERFKEQRYAEYIEEGFTPDEAGLMAELDLEAAGDLAGQVYEA